MTSQKSCSIGDWVFTSDHFWLGSLDFGDGVGLGTVSELVGGPGDFDGGAIGSGVAVAASHGVGSSLGLVAREALARDGGGDGVGGLHVGLEASVLVELVVIADDLCVLLFLGQGHGHQAEQHDQFHVGWGGGVCWSRHEGVVPM